MSALKAASMAFGANVARLRRASGLRGYSLAAKVGVTSPVISAWENGRNGLPETPSLLKLAKALKCSIDDLLVGVDPDYDSARAAAIDGEHRRDIEAIRDGIEPRATVIPELAALSVEERLTLLENGCRLAAGLANDRLCALEGSVAQFQLTAEIGADMLARISRIAEQASKQLEVIRRRGGGDAA